MSRTRTLVVACCVLVAAIAALGAGTTAPAAGSAAPAFTLTNNNGDPTKLSDFHGKWVVLYFYPKDFTSGCTLEAHNFQADLKKYEQLNAVILGVSVDTAARTRISARRKG